MKDDLKDLPKGYYVITKPLRKYNDVEDEFLEFVVVPLQTACERGFEIYVTAYGEECRKLRITIGQDAINHPFMRLGSFQTFITLPFGKNLLLGYWDGEQWSKVDPYDPHVLDTQRKIANDRLVALMSKTFGDNLFVLFDWRPNSSIFFIATAYGISPDGELVNTNCTVTDIVYDSIPTHERERIVCKVIDGRIVPLSTFTGLAFSREADFVHGERSTYIVSKTHPVTGASEAGYVWVIEPTHRPHAPDFKKMPADELGDSIGEDDVVGFMDISVWGRGPRVARGSFIQVDLSSVLDDSDAVFDASMFVLKCAKVFGKELFYISETKSDDKTPSTLAVTLSSMVSDKSFTVNMDYRRLEPILTEINNGSGSMRVRSGALLFD